MEKINNVISQIDSYVWGIPLIILIMACGILLTIRLRFLQIRKLGTALKYMVKNEEGGSGEVSSFAALCTALSATVGTGNIVGVATAIAFRSRVERALEQQLPQHVLQPAAQRGIPTGAQGL